MIRWVRRMLSRGRQVAKIGDDGLCVVVAQLPGIGVGHDDQPATIAIDTIANGPENLAIRPATERPGRSEIGRDEGANRHRQIITDVGAAGERRCLRMTAATEAVGDFLAALNLVWRAGNLQRYR